MESVNLEGFLRRATPYERWRAPLDPKLRQAALLSGISIAIALVTLWALPGLQSLSDSPFFLVLDSQFDKIMTAMHQMRTILITLNLICVGMYAALLVTTRGLQTGRVAWHWIAFGEVVVGAGNGFVLAFEAAILVINAMLWIIAITMVMLLVLGLVMALANGLSN